MEKFPIRSKGEKEYFVIIDEIDDDRYGWCSLIEIYKVNNTKIYEKSYYDYVQVNKIGYKKIICDIINDYECFINRNPVEEKQKRFKELSDWDGVIK